MNAYPKYLNTSKNVGETPLQALEQLRSKHSISADTPLAYAGRLDPMASGALLILVGDECKVQEKYHGLDKEYVFEILLGATSDTGDVLGLTQKSPILTSTKDIQEVLKKLVGPSSLPYPHFSSKTVQGKPLHIWALENRLNEIEIPVKHSVIHSLQLLDTYTIPADQLIKKAAQKINSIPKVTEESKALGADFRRHEVRNTWQGLYGDDPDAIYTVHKIKCIASSGTYMRSLAEVIGTQLGTGALALSIHRTRIGKYLPIPIIGGIWLKTFAKVD